MTYLEYKKEQLAKLGKGVRKWWRQYGFIFAILGWIFPMVIGLSLGRYSEVVGAVFVISALVWLVSLLLYGVIGQELDSYREWKEKHASKETTSQ